MSGDSTVLTKQQLAVYLRCSTKTIERRMREGMPSFKVGGLRRFRLDLVEAWLAEQELDHGTRKSKRRSGE